MLFVALTVKAQVLQPGIVLQYNEEMEKTPMENVEVIVSDAGQRITDKNGKFELRFRTKKKGDRVLVTRIEKPGYEIFNKEAVEQWNIAGEEIPFVIVMCNTQKFKKIRDNYERVTSESYKRQEEEEKKRLYAEKVSGKLKEEEYKAKLIQLKDEFDQQLESARPYLERFARIDLSEVSEAERIIIKMIQEGKIDEGIELYKKLNPEEIFKHNRELKKELDVSADSAFSMVTRKNDALLMQGGRNNLQMVEDSYKSIAECDTTYLYGLSAYSFFLGIRHRDKENLRYLHLLNNCGEKEYHQHLSSMYHSTGYAYYKLGEIEKAEKYFNKSYYANKLYNSSDTLLYKENLATYYGDMALIFDLNNKPSEQDSILNIECELLDSLCEVNIDKYGVLMQMALMNLLNLYCYYKPEKTLEVIEKAKQLFDKRKFDTLEEQNAAKALLWFGFAQSAFANSDTLYAESLLKQAAEVLAPLYKKDPEQYNLLYGPILSVLGNQYYVKGKYLEAESHLSKAVPICEEALNQNPRRVLETLVAAQILLGKIRLEYGYPEAADSLFRVAYDNYSKMKALDERSSIHNSKMKTPLIDSLMQYRILCIEGIANSNMMLGNDSIAEHYFRDIIETDRELMNQYGEDFGCPGSWYAFYNLGVICWRQKRYDEAEEFLTPCVFFYDDDVSDEEKRNVRFLLIELLSINKHYDIGLKFADAFLDEAEGMERLRLIHAKGVYYLKKGDVKMAKKMWKILEKHDSSWVPKDSLLRKTFKK